MVDLKFGLRSVDLPYTIRLYGVSEEQFDDLVDEDTKAELLDGVMIVHSPATPSHDDIAGFLRTLLRCYAESKDIGRVFGPDALVRLRRSRRFGPDVFFLHRRQIGERLPRDQFNLVPDLIVEVLSPSNRDYDLDEKRPAYRAAGVREIWLVDPQERRLIQDRRRGERYTTRTMNTGRATSVALPGFWLDVAWLWADLLPNVMTCLREILG